MDWYQQNEKDIILPDFITKKISLKQKTHKCFKWLDVKSENAVTLNKKLRFYKDQ